MLIGILIAIAAIIVLLVIVVAMQSAELRIVRKTLISATPASVFPQVNDFHNWNAWSPWAKLDPNMKQTFAGAPAGVGAAYSWIGNKKVGEGRMTILESKPSDFVAINLEFLKPFKATNRTEFAFKPEGNQTEVTWSMFGKKNFFFKAFGLIMNMDKMIGRDFEKGLASMKAVAETSPRR